jgi:hypothetical protein
MLRPIFAGSLLLSVTCFAQVRGGHSGYSGGGVHSGYGYGHPGRGYVYAYPLYVGGYGGYGSYFGDYSSGYAPSYPPPGYASGVDPSMQPPAAPPVVINQYFGAPPPMAGAPDQPPTDDQSIHFYGQQGAPTGYSPAPASDNRTYLIAYKDHSVYTAIAYWIEGSTLHYVTTANTHNQADLNLIDIDFTKKLNADRSMPFNVPAQ